MVRKTLCFLKTIKIKSTLITKIIIFFTYYAFTETRDVKKEQKTENKMY